MYISRATEMGTAILVAQGDELRMYISRATEMGTAILVALIEAHTSGGSEIRLGPGGSIH